MSMLGMTAPARMFQQALTVLIALTAVLLVYNVISFRSSSAQVDELRSLANEQTLLARECRANKSQVYSDVRDLGNDINARKSVDDVDVKKTKKEATKCRKDLKHLSAQLQHEQDSAKISKARLAKDTWHHRWSMHRLLMLLKDLDEPMTNLKAMDDVRRELIATIREQRREQEEANEDERRKSEEGAGAGEGELGGIGEQQGQGEDAGQQQAEEGQEKEGEKGDGLDDLTHEELIALTREIALKRLLGEQ